MGNLINNADYQELARQACDDVINEWGKTCRLLYPPRREDCPNCKFISILGRSSSVYQEGGPVPFTDGEICPYCEGNGWRETPVTATITMAIAWTPSQFFQKLPPNTQLPAGTIQSKGYVSDLPRVLQAGRMIVEVGMSPIIGYTYERMGEPIDIHNMNQGRYFVCMWKRVEG